MDPRFAQDHGDLFAELQTLRTQNQTLSSDLSSLHSKLSLLKDEIAKQKRKRLSAQKESKELKEENRRLNVLVANLQGLPHPEPASEENAMSPGSGKLKRPVLPSSTPPQAPLPAPLPQSSPNGSSAHSSSKRWALTDDSIAAISASLSNTMPILGGSPKSVHMPPRPSPPSTAPPGSIQIVMGSAPMNYLNPGSGPLPPALTSSGGGGGGGAGAGAGSSGSPVGRGDSPMLVHSSSSGSLRFPLTQSGSGNSISIGAGNDVSKGNIFGTPTDVLYAQDQSIRAASLDTLIRLLPSSDSNYIDTFLMTYRAFCSAEELFNRMVSLWDAASVQGSNEGLKVFRIKFMNVMIKWIEKHGVDFDDSSLLKMSKFLDIKLAEGAVSSTTHDKIAKLIRHKLERTSKKVLHNSDLQAPAPLLPTQDLDELDVTILEPLEVARQITLLDEQAYKSIAASECMNQSWNKPAICNEVSPNIIKMIARFNATSNWSARLIVAEPTIRKRKSILTRIIKLAQRLRELHNYHSLMAIIAALESAPVARLKKTWDSVDSAYLKQFQELRAIMSAEGSYKAFRAIIKTEDPPVIPYIGVYLADLTFIEDGNPSKLQHETMGELINFAKMKLLDSVIQDINMYQQAPYKLEPVPRIQMLLISQEDIRSTDKELFDMSLKSEPRVAPK
jgi:son of sevenless-like protein